jgi:hypothetical protein
MTEARRAAAHAVARLWKPAGSIDFAVARSFIVAVAAWIARQVALGARHAQGLS